MKFVELSKNCDNQHTSDTILTEYSLEPEKVSLNLNAALKVKVYSASLIWKV